MQQQQTRNPARGQQNQTATNPYLQVTAKAPKKATPSLAQRTFAINYANRSTPSLLHDLVKMVGYQVLSLVQ